MFWRDGENNAQLFTVPPYAVAYIVQVAVAYGADKTNR